tara:strand:- start:997 stop:1284 length:288 start_codon:yes stop_codon:yes gene_type:complete
MKKFIKKLPLVAFVFALVAAFAFNMPEEEAVTTHWFELDDAGNIGDPINPMVVCLGSSQNCAVGLSDDQVDSGTGEPLYDSIDEYDEEPQVAKRS